ncbi:glycosyltransferase family 2 protein [candidate division TA06 bacterium]|nr:glycosyltransferase family 2 protein [candidate division TA06 bacterium]
MNNIYVIILNWNNLHDTLECVNSLKNSSTIVSKIIIVDNGSTDDSGRILKEKYVDERSIEFIVNDKNEGFSRGINIGVIKAIKENPDYILLLNNDAFLDVNCINNLLKAFVANNRCGVAGPRIFYSHKKDIIWQGGGHFNCWTGGNVVPEKNRIPKVFKDEYVNATFMTGCIMLIKREVFEEIGLLDEDIFFYEEDVDFCLRAAKAGFKLIYVPSAVAWHKVEGIRITPFAFYNRARSRIIVLRKNFNIIYVWYGILLHIILFTPYKIYQSIKSDTPLETLVAWFKGSIDGVSAKLHYKETSLNKK